MKELLCTFGTIHTIISISLVKGFFDHAVAVIASLSLLLIINAFLICGTFCGALDFSERLARNAAIFLP